MIVHKLQVMRLNWSQ